MGIFRSHLHAHQSDVGVRYGNADDEARELILRSIEIEAEKGLPGSPETWVEGLDGPAKTLGEHVVVWIGKNILPPFRGPDGKRLTFTGFSGSFAKSVAKGSATINAATNSAELREKFEAQDRVDRAAGIRPLSSARVLQTFRRVLDQA